MFKFLLVFFLFLLFFGCGNPPPPEFFSGTNLDSLSIRAIAETTRAFQITAFSDSLIPLDSSSFAILSRYARKASDRSQAKFLTTSFGLKIVSEKVNDTLLFIKDTTATLILRNELTGELSLRICSITPYDSNAGMYDTLFLPVDSVVKKSFRATTWQWGHFEPIKKDTAERTWRLVKITGCYVISIPDEENSVLIPYPVALISPLKVDSVFSFGYMSPRDSTKFGDRRLYYYLDTACLKKDSLLFFTGGKTLKANITPWLNPDDTVLKFISFMDNSVMERKEAMAGITLPTFSLPTFSRINLMVFTCEALTYEKKNLRGIIWGVSSRIK
ncbi:MAG: hypothetical protein ABIK97_00605 [candidate division WOR-3 bacterium]